MEKEKICSLINEVRKKTPLIHCITNYVTVNDCANVLLAIGASPIMADDISETSDITSISKALVINIGTLNERTVASMIASGKRANQLGIPVILDPVGAGASTFRNDTVTRILSEVKLSIIRGNLSEMSFIAGLEASTKGVDTSEADADNDAVAVAKAVAKKYSTVSAITGATDVISDGKRVAKLTNGVKLLSKVTGTGCMTSALVGAFAGAVSGEYTYFHAAVAGIAAMGIAGELACQASCKGTGSFHISIIDEISKMSANMMTDMIKLIYKAVDYTLYLCTDRKLMSSKTIEENVELAIKGGCTVIQLREKDCSSAEFFEIAKNVKAITDKYSVPLIINDRVDIALAIDAAGVHVGQSDLPCALVRRIIGENKIIGVSTANLNEAKKAYADGADYIGVGAMYSTNTKTDTRPVSMDELMEIRKNVDLPIVVIGGINMQTLYNFKNRGIDGLAVVSAIVAADDVSGAARKIYEEFTKK